MLLRLRRPLLLLLLASFTESRNIVITSDGVALATAADGSSALVTYDAPSRTEASHNFASASTPGGFDDVALDPASAAGGGGTAAFALDAGSGIVCSFILSKSLSQVISLDLVGCATQTVNTSPFVGIAAEGGTLIVSGGTGGASVFTYDENTAVLSATPIIRNRRLGDIGYPDVTLVTPTLAAFSADASDISNRFGVVVSSIDLAAGSLTRDRVFPTNDSVGFTYALGPASFPLTTALYAPDGDSGRQYLYVANGGIVVLDPEGTDGATAVNVIPNGFRALAASVNSERGVAVFGGVLEGTQDQSALVALDLSNPTSPTLATTDVSSLVGGRITGVASAGLDVVYVMENSASIGHGILDTPVSMGAQIASDV